MMKTLLTLTAGLFLGTPAPGLPTPIPPPRQDYEKACELVLLKHRQVSGGGKPLKWSNTTFPQMVIYTSYQYSPDLQGYVEDRKLSRKQLKAAGKDWLLTEWGWLISVVVGLDLSQSDTYFVRPSGEVSLLWTTN